MELAEFVAAEARRQGVPGVSVGVWDGGREIFAAHGVTSVDNPLPVDRDTIFAVGSVSKTFTATTLMHLVADGAVDLDAPVRDYLPELRLADERHAARITVRQLANHTAGLGGALLLDSGDGDDALARYVAALPGLELVAGPGERASYSQAGYNIIGRIIEKVAGRPFEHVVQQRVFEPLGLRHTCYFAGDVMTRRFTVGHNGTEIARLRKRRRGDNPGGGAESSAADLVRWARYHLREMGEMQERTVQLRGSSLGDGLGICWFLGEAGGVRTVGHGGSTNGQFAELLLVPERDFAVVSLANAAPGGIPCNRSVVRWALQRYLGVAATEPEPLPFEPGRAAELAGTYEQDAMVAVIDVVEGRLRLAVGIKAEVRAAAATDLPADYPPAWLGRPAGDGEEYIIMEGALEGQRGFFTRDEAGTVTGVDLAGRMFGRRR